MAASARIVVTVTILAAFATAAGCDRAGPTSTVPGPSTVVPAATTTAPATTTTVPAPPATSSRPSAAGGAASWRSDPITVRRTPPVPPLPVVTGIRYAAHPQEGFDRVVIDVRGPLPGYTVRYVSEVRADGSGQRVSVPGRRHLLLVLTPAYAHEEDGQATVTGIHRTNLPMLTSYAVVSDFEGYVRIALGLDDVVGFRVGELPGRIYLDVAA